MKVRTKEVLEGLAIMLATSAFFLCAVLYQIDKGEQEKAQARGSIYRQWIEQQKNKTQTQVNRRNCR